MNSTIKPSACKTCGSPYHSAMYHKPRKPIETTKPLPRATKPIKKHGKVHDEWMRLRGDWLTANPTPWVCHYCGSKLDITSITLDHRIPRSRAPELRLELSNLVPACMTCNKSKGSVDHDSYKHDCPDNVKETA